MKRLDQSHRSAQILLFANRLPGWYKIAILALSLLAFLLSFPYLHPVFGDVVAVLALIPALAAIFLYGFWGGLLTSLFMIILNISLLVFHMGKPIDELMVAEGWLGAAFMLFFGVVTGWLRDMLLVSGREQQSLRKSEAKYRTIYKISAAAQSAANLDVLFQSIHAALGEVLRADNFYIALYDPVTTELSFPYFQDAFDAPPPPKKIGRGLTEYILRTGKPLLASKEELLEMEAKGLIELRGAPCLYWLGVPLLTGGQPTGVMVLQSYRRHVRFGEEEKNFLTFVSEQVAMAIERKQAEEKLKYLSIHDALTGLYNRAYFEDELERLEGGRQFPVSLIMVDLNGLKRVNDQLGHPAGDDLLRRTAQVLRSVFRSEDGVARIGGDEFAVVLPRVEAHAAEEAVKRIRAAVRKHNQDYPDLQLSLSIGSATVDKGVPLIEAFRQADMRMYLDKVHRPGYGAS